MGILGALLAVAAFIAVMVLLSRLLGRRLDEGHFDKEGHGRNRPQEGVHYRPLDVPGKPPFD